MTLQEILNDCYRRLNFTVTPLAGVTARLTAFVNDAQRRVLTMPGMELLREASMAATSVVGQPRLALPPTVAQLRAITDPINQLRLVALRRGDARWLTPGLPIPVDAYPLDPITFLPIIPAPVGIGTPDWYAPLGQEVVAYQPIGPSGLWLASSVAGDLANPVTLEGVTTGGFQTGVVNATLSGIAGTTRKQVGTRTDWIQVSKWGLITPAQGAVSLYDSAAGGVELARIEPGRLSTKYLIIALLPTPSAAVTYTIDYQRKITDLTQTDEPPLPEDFHYVLGLMACRREYLFADDKERYTQMAFEEQEAIRALRAFVLYPPDYRVRNNDPEREQGPWGSNLGPAFPAGRW